MGGHSLTLMEPYVRTYTAGTRTHAFFLAMRGGLLAVAVAVPVCEAAGGPQYRCPGRSVEPSFWNGIFCLCISASNLLWVVCLRRPFTRLYDAFVCILDEIVLCGGVVLTLILGSSAAMAVDSTILMVGVLAPICLQVMATFFTATFHSARSDSAWLRIRIATAAFYEARKEAADSQSGPRDGLKNHKINAVHPIVDYCDSSTNSSDSSTDSDSDSLEFIGIPNGKWAPKVLDTSVLSTLKQKQKA